ncbi:sacsin N-terminal ATP-binding-like domain-containing protein [Actinosynnema pretiosum]|uniref:Molecular chaperone Hsp90 n=1 Tax=Actinosynnema pretiosum TaxID=42197 RepID=A0A290YZW7_9PSEU|nr:hypothetical protein [Actinosynnema pretiosum]ATE52302.1 hypothetical protein CNX65_02475 [Actinosynnema pretiosum]
MSADHFGTEALRESVLAAWRGSPTRFREDANAEEDLRLGGYRDRLLVELAQNAADAAGAEPGVLRLSFVDGEFRAANTGAPLTADGVTALASLRASAKSSDAVGQFGVGFAAVLAVTDAPRVVSTSGGVAFSAARTREAVPELASKRGGDVPVLRLVWPTDEAGPPEGFTTEVRLPLTSADGDALLRECAEQAPDLLLALPGLRRVEVGSRAWDRAEDGDKVVITGPDGERAWLVHRVGGELPERFVQGVESRPVWSACWAYPVDGALGGEVLHAPTPTDEKLSLPARLIATLPVEPSRRRVLVGPAVEHVLAMAARAYPALVAALPAVERTALVPLPGFPLSEVDGVLRQGVLEALRDAEWLPKADGGWTSPRRAKVLDSPSEDLVDLLEDVVPGLLDAELVLPEHARALAALDVPRMPVAEVVAALAGIGGEPGWWHDVYTALQPWADVDSSAREELGSLPVPLADGRLVSGPRGVLMLDEPVDFELTGLRIAHPEAVHPLLLRLGAVEAGAAEVLDSDAVRDAVRHSGDDPDEDLVHGVLSLVARAGGRPWLGELVLPEAGGGWRRADELLLPDAPLREVLADDAPFGVLDAEFAADWPREVLSAVGAADGFTVLVDDEPTDPDHDLADEADWWDAADEPPSRVVGVRDLDLVAEGKWTRALELMASDPEVWRAVAQRDGYTGWWLARYARIDGRAPRAWRLPGAVELEGLYDPVGSELPAHVLAAAGVRTELVVHDEDDVVDLLARLGDAERVVPDALVLKAHAALAEVAPDVREGAVEPPDRVRVLTGAVVSADDVVVPDLPWLLAVLPGEQVLAADGGAAELAELLELPLASEEVVGALRSEGDEVVWAELGAVRVACALLGVELPRGTVVVHDELVVHAEGEEHEVPWWVDGEVVHAADTPEGLARALAWTTGRWGDRHTFAALISEPTPAVLLG